MKHAIYNEQGKAVDVGAAIATFSGFCAKGLCSGPQRAGLFCVEVAMFSALNPDSMEPEDHNDCVNTDINDAKIALNDSSWSSADARARGLHDLGIAQLGTAVIKNAGHAIYDAEAIIREIYMARVAAKAKLPTFDRNNPEASIDKLRAALDALEDQLYSQPEEFDSLTGAFQRKGKAGYKDDTGLLIMANVLLAQLRKIKSPGVAWLDRYYAGKITHKVNGKTVVLKPNKKLRLPKVPIA